MRRSRSPYGPMPLKDVAADDRDFFESFAEGSSSGKRITRFTVPIDFGGTTSPFYIYVIAGKNGCRQVQDQFIWVTEYRGGKVPPEVLESFHKLNRIAVENNVDFRELCVYALGDSPKKSEAKTAGGS
jgi:Domain of unknown function (DUF2610)